MCPPSRLVFGTLVALSYFLHGFLNQFSMLDTWRSELTLWAPQLKFIIYRGNKEERRRIREVEMKECKFNVMVTQYEFLLKTGDSLAFRRTQWSHIIVDEGHRVKNAACKLVQSLNTVTSRHRVLLTGTPLQVGDNEIRGFGSDCSADVSVFEWPPAE